MMIIIKTKAIIPQTDQLQSLSFLRQINFSRSLFRSLILLFPKTFKLFSFQIFQCDH